MANTSAICSSFKSELMLGIHQLGAATLVSRTSLTSPTTDTIKAALYLASATLGPGTTAYGTTGEVTATGTYVAGGATVSNATAPSTVGTTGVWTPSAPLQWTGVTMTAFDTVLFYNATQNNRAIGVYTFGSQTVTAGTFTLSMPTNDAANALLRVA